MAYFWHVAVNCYFLPLRLILLCSGFYGMVEQHTKSLMFYFIMGTRGKVFLIKFMAIKMSLNPGCQASKKGIRHSVDTTDGMRLYFHSEENAPSEHWNSFRVIFGHNFDWCRLGFYGLGEFPFLKLAPAQVFSSFFSPKVQLANKTSARLNVGSWPWHFSLMLYRTVKSVF